MAALLCVAAILSSCQSGDQNSAATGRRSGPDSALGRLTVLTSIAPLYSITVNVAGDLARVENLLPSGAGPHEYSFSPDDVRKVHEADVLVINGMNLETWLEGVVRSEQEVRSSWPGGNAGLIVVDTSRGVRTIDDNPHIWLSPASAVVQTGNIREALIAADPVHAEAYRDNADAFIQRLKRLDSDIRRMKKQWRTDQFVSFHSAFSYFARDYGLRQVAVIQDKSGIDPSPRHVASVIDLMTAHGIHFIFSETGVRSKIVDAIAGDLEARVYYLQTLESGEMSGDAYEKGMRDNLAIMNRAFGGQET